MSGQRTGLLAACRRVLHLMRLRLFPVRDPWARLPYEAPLAAFGDGARHGFDWVFEGQTATPVQTFDDIVAWLASCSYQTDTSLFQESDYWQHPNTFEQLRRGDCEDFALWAWRRMLEIGIDADLVIGRRVPPGAENSRHAWILFRQGDDEFLFEPILCHRGNAVSPVATVRDEYIPEFGVARDRRRFLFAGHLYFLQNRHLGRVRAEPGSDSRVRQGPLPATDR